jgi:3-deoxy-7-phosphoheptulonate synthase
MIESKYIEGLIKSGKLGLSINRQIEFVAGRSLFSTNSFTMISGPCSVVDEGALEIQARKLKSMGIMALRAGAYKPCTYPVTKAHHSGWKEGLQKEGIEIIGRVGKQLGMTTVTEIIDPRDLEHAVDHIDMVQVGARNAQNYPLLDELGRSGVPVLLKRGTWMTIDEVLGAVERILYHGNSKVAICLRGVVGAPQYRHVWPEIRWAPDLMMIPAIKSLNSRIPVIYDPSHACGKRDFVGPMAIAAIAAGADGLIIESHLDPANSISDPDQAVTLETLGKILEKARAAYAIRW